MVMRILVAVGLTLAAPALLAYQIVEGRYRVETSPGVFEDQLVVRCDDGRTLTLPWETRLAEACGEGLMGERVGKASKATPPAAPVEAAAVTTPDDAAAEPAVVPAAPTTSSLVDEAAQREAMLTQLRAQLGDIPDRYVEFKPGPDGLSMRLLPPLNEIIKKYEACRRAREPGAQCAAVRDQAIAKLKDAAPTTETAAAPAAAAGAKPGKPAAPKASAARGDAGETQATKATAAKGEANEPHAPKSSAAAASDDAAVAAATPAVSQPGAADAKAQAPAVAAVQPAPDRAGKEQKIAEDHALCLRLKPKFECDQARARALGVLDRPKAVKPARAVPAKQARHAPTPAPAAPASPAESKVAAAPQPQ
jgi:hypothetical protein